MAAPPDAPHPPPGGTPLLVGRAREQAILRDALAAALAGHGALVLIGGEAGIGKTALAEWLLAEATSQGALVLVGRCYDLSETPPYGPWAEALARAPRGEGLPAPPDLAGDGATSQAALFAQVHDFLATLAARHPLVVLLDDLHWGDPASLDLLRVVARGLADLPILLLVTYRPDEIAADHPLAVLLPLLVREARAARLDLRPLDAGAIGALVAARYALGEAERARLVGYLAGRTEGNALFLGEVLRTLEGEGALQRARDGWALGDLAGVPVPPLLRQVIAGRVARLDPAAARLLAVAAVVGHAVPLDLWAAAAETDDGGLFDAIDVAADARLVAVSPDGARVHFAHALIREALYEAIPPGRRRRVHLRAGEALAATPQPDPDALAHHFGRAGDARAAAWLVAAGERAERAHAYVTAAARYEAAAALLARRGGDAGERGWLLLRLAQVGDLHDARRNLAAAAEAARLAAAAGDRALAAAALCRQGRAHFVLREHRPGFACLEAGVAAVEALPPAERARLNRLDTLGGGASAINRYLGLLAYMRAVLGPFSAAVALGERLVSQAPAPTTGAGLDAATVVALGSAHEGLGIAHRLLGRPAAARRALAEARAGARLGGSDFRVGAIAEQELLLALAYAPEQVAARRQLADEMEAAFARGRDEVPLVPRLYRLPLLVLEGQWAEARALAAAGSTGAVTPGARMAARLWLATVTRAQGAPELAWAQVRALLPDGPAGDLDEPGPVEARLLPLAAALAREAGDLAQARAWLAMHDRWLAWSGAVLGQAEGQLAWSAYHRAVGDAALAARHAEQALAHAGAPRQPLALLASHRLLGELDTTAGRHTAALAHLAEALVLAEACAAPYERALALLATADLHATTGDHDGARVALEEARGLLAPLEARPALARADALAERLAAPPSPPAPAALPFGLTAREAVVLRLVAEGLTDAQVAARLFVSRSTVNTHTRAIYGKLGVTSRAAATRLAIDHGLR